MDCVDRKWNEVITVGRRNSLMLFALDVRWGAGIHV